MHDESKDYRLSGRLKPQHELEGLIISVSIVVTKGKKAKVKGIGDVSFMMG